MEAASVVIVGAGAAGIAAATKLLELGFLHVLLLEAENRIGGRIHTIPFADNVVDMGAQFCHGEENNVIYELVKERNMLDGTPEWYTPVWNMRSDGKRVPDEDTENWQTFENATMSNYAVDLLGYEGSYGAYLTDKFWRAFQNGTSGERQLYKELFDNFKRKECVSNAADNLFEVSAKGLLEYKECAGNLYLNWKDKGYLSFLRLLMSANADVPTDWGVLNRRVQLNKRVVHIDWGGKPVSTLRLYSGEIVQADHVIFTGSLGVLKTQHQRLFSPHLPPANERAINGLTFGGVGKIYLEFKEPLADWGEVCFLWRDEDLAQLRNSSNFWLEGIVDFHRVPYQPRLLEGWLYGAQCRHMETLPEAEVLEGAMWLLKKFMGFDIPQPVNFLRTQWHANPNFRGTYSFRSLLTEEWRTGAKDLSAPLLDAAGKPLVLFAGEATHESFYSTAHGAVASGWREADRLYKYYNGNKVGV